MAKAKPAKSSSKAKAQPKLDVADWRDATLARVRDMILKVDSAIIEERKWKKPSNGMVGVPVWSLHGIICTGETYRNVVKLTFAHGAQLPDPAGLFNSSLEGNMRRAIDIREGESIDAKAFQALVKAAIARNGASPKPAKTVKLLSGGNPQIAKGDGDAPVQAYIAAMPGWKGDVGRRLDSLIMKIVPNVRKAVRWNTPFYGIEGQGWFLAFHCLTKSIKLAFFRGTSLRPVPPVESKQAEVRYFHISEVDTSDEQLVSRWIQQASKLPGVDVFS